MFTKVFYIVTSIFVCNLSAAELNTSVQDALRSKSDRVVTNDKYGRLCWLIERDAGGYNVYTRQVEGREEGRLCVKSDDKSDFKGVQPVTVGYLRDQKGIIVKEPVEDIIMSYLEEAYGCSSNVFRYAGLEDASTEIKVSCEEAPFYFMTIDTRYYVMGDNRLYTDPDSVQIEFLQGIENDPVKQGIVRACFAVGNADDDQLTDNRESLDTGIRIPSGSRDFLEELRNCAPELLSGYMANNGQLVRVRNGLDHIHTRSSGSWADENVKQDIRMGIMIGMFVPVPVGGTFSVSLTEIVGTRPGYFFTAGENAIIGLLRRKGVESIISRPISGVPHGVSVLTTERQAMTAIPFNHHGVEDLLRSF